MLQNCSTKACYSGDKRAALVSFIVGKKERHVVKQKDKAFSLFIGFTNAFLAKTLDFSFDLTSEMAFKKRQLHPGPDPNEEDVLSELPMSGRLSLLLAVASTDHPRRKRSDQGG